MGGPKLGILTIIGPAMLELIREVSQTTFHSIRGMFIENNSS